MFDGGGLYLTITPAGAAVWRLKYRIGGRERLVAAGVHPEVSLAGARAKRDAIRAQLRDGVDPIIARVNREASATTTLWCRRTLSTTSSIGKTTTTHVLLKPAATLRGAIWKWRLTWASR
ncbi:MAG: Arm DNA-binding domain-containing protein [Gemmatimonadaceae bacterium]